jgi:N utilization substance protein B
MDIVEEKQKLSKRRTRVNAMLMLYGYDFHSSLTKDEYITNCKEIINDLKNYEKDELLMQIVNHFFENHEKIDYLITEMSNLWSFEKISDINKAILRVSFVECLFFSEKLAIIINEYIEITKIYSGADDHKYIHLMIGRLNEWRTSDDKTGIIRQD